MAFIDITDEFGYVVGEKNKDFKINFTINSIPTNEAKCTFALEYSSDNWQTTKTLPIKEILYHYNNETKVTPNVLRTTSSAVGSYTITSTAPNINSNELQIRVCIQTTSVKYASLPVPFSVNSVLQFELTNPVETNYLVTRVKVELVSQMYLPEGIKINVYVCNNPFDNNRVWEDITDKFNENSYADLENTEILSNKYGVNIKVVATKTNINSKIKISEVNFAYY